MSGSPAQMRFIDRTKGEIAKSVKRTGNVARGAPRTCQGSYPFSDIVAHPRNPVLSDFLDLDPYYLHSIAVFVPEFLWPDDFLHGVPPCPKCGLADSVVSNGGLRGVGEF
jgi:hypothetical protein